jgi:type IV secretion system protein VirD4
MYRQVRPHTVWQALERSLWLWGTVACLLWAGIGLMRASERVANSLHDAGWEKTLGTTEPAATLASCAMNTACSSNLELVLKGYDRSLYLAPFVLLAVIGLLLQGFKGYPAYRSIAAGRWATRKELKKYLEPRAIPLVGYLGLIPKLEWVPTWLWENWNYTALAIPEDEFNEHTLVHGPPGSGKTAGLFRPMLLRAAIQGRSAVVFDVKYPDQRQGLFACIGEFRALERQVEVFTPYAATSGSLDLFVGCEVFDKALEVATIFVPLSEGEDRYYRDQERRLLAGFIVDGKLKHGVRLDQILERLNSGVAALETYVKHNPHMTAKLRTFIELPKDRIVGAMTGLAATLEPFTRGQTALRLNGSGNPINLERVFREPTLLYIGIPQADVIAGHGALLMRLVKRVVDEVALRVAETSSDGHVPIGTGVYLDELLNLGRLDNLENMLATLRSRGIGYVLGVQGDDQGRALYGREVWQAIQKTCRHKVYFLGALDPRDALEISKTLGEMTVFEQTVVESGGESGNRSGTTTREAKRSLVSMEEMLSWERFHAVVLARNLAPFRVMCYPLFDRRHPEHGLHTGITEIAAQLPKLEKSSEQTKTSNPILESPVNEPPVNEPLEIAQLIFTAVEQTWPCELLRERGKIIAVRLKPRAPFLPTSVSDLTWDGTILELRGLERVTEEFINALVWLRRRTELEVWLATHNIQIKGRPGYAGQPLGELEGEVLCLQASAVAEVFGRGYLQKKTIVKRTVDATELEVIAVKLQHGGLEKLRTRIKTLEAGQG